MSWGEKQEWLYKKNYYKKKYLNMNVMNVQGYLR